MRCGVGRRNLVSRQADEAHGWKVELTRWADVAQLVERVLGKDEVTGSIPVIGSSAFAKVKGLSGSNSVVESQPSKLLVAGSIPVSRSRFDERYRKQVSVTGVNLETFPRRSYCRGVRLGGSS
jgi:hypothetical protein